jgi:hypothetical protein
MVVIAVLVAGLLGVLLVLLQRADDARKAERDLLRKPLAGKQMRLVLKTLKIAFGVLAWAALLGAGIGLGAEAIHWLETGTWAVGKTLGEAWPALAESVAAMKWTGAQPIALWVVAQSLNLVYAALALVFSLLGFLVVKLSEESGQGNGP